MNVDRESSQTSEISMGNRKVGIDADSGTLFTQKNHRRGEILDPAVKCFQVCTCVLRQRLYLECALRLAAIILRPPTFQHRHEERMNQRREEALSGDFIRTSYESGRYNRRDILSRRDSISHFSTSPQPQISRFLKENSSSTNINQSRR